MLPHNDAYLLLILALTVFTVEILSKDTRYLKTRRQADLAGQDGCLTSSGTDGICVPFRQCEKEAPTSSRRRPAICRWETFGPVICCPSSEDTSTQAQTPLTQIPSTDRPKNISATITLVNKTVPKCGLAQVNFKRRSRQLSLDGEEPTKSNVGEFVIGGTDAVLGKWPWMALLFVDDDEHRKTPLCGATLISDTTVVTAAHCFIGTNNSTIVVRLGMHIVRTSSSDAGFKEIKVRKIIQHEGFKYPAIYNDIALLKLASKVIFSARIQPVCLPSSDMNNEDFVDKRATVTGFGQKEFGGASASILQEVDLSVFSNVDCNKEYKSLAGAAASLPSGVTDVIVCAGSKTEAKDACPGDSGGPLVLQSATGNWILIGVVSAGFNCGHLVPGLYTRVTKYLDWIESN